MYGYNSKCKRNNTFEYNIIIMLQRKMDDTHWEVRPDWIFCLASETCRVNYKSRGKNHTVMNKIMT